MSNKSARKPQKAPSQPRELEVIQREYAQAAIKAGGAQYQITVLQEELDAFNKELRSLNHEAHARQQLDAVKQTVAEATEATNGQ